MYRFYYNHEIPNDVLFVLINPQKRATSCLRNGDIVTLLSGEERIGINIFNISTHIEIPHDGAFFSGDKSLFAAINILLISEKLPPLEKNENSGFFVAEIEKLEEHPLDDKSRIVTLSLGDKKVQTVSSFSGLEIGERVVVKTDGCLDREGKLFQSHVEKNIPIDVEICSFYDLQFASSSENSPYIESKKAVGVDFFE